MAPIALIELKENPGVGDLAGHIELREAAELPVGRIIKTQILTTSSVIGFGGATAQNGTEQQQ